MSRNKDDIFGDNSSVCKVNMMIKAAIFFGIAKNEESSQFKIKVMKIQKFLPDNSENNGI